MNKSNHKAYFVKNLEELKNLELPTGQEVKVLFTFDNKDSYLFKDESINFNFTLEDGTKIEKEILLWRPYIGM